MGGAAWIRAPALDDGIDNPPGAFDFVAANEELGIAVDGIEDQALVGIGQIIGVKGIFVKQLHIDRLGDLLIRDFGVDGQVDTLIGLDAD